MRKTLLSLASVTVLMAGRILAQDCANADFSRMRNLSLNVENDIVAGTDKDYTHGTRFGYVSPDIETWRLPAWVRTAGGKLPIFHHNGYTNNIGISAGQNIYTPSEIKDPNLRKDDRPYAGWLYGTMSLHHKNEVNLHKLEISLGMVGPHSFAEDVQTSIHDWSDSTIPEGWDHQLNDEPGIILAYEYKRRVELKRSTVDFIPSYQLSVGNVLTSAKTSVTARCGYNVPRDFHSTRISSCGYAKPAGLEGCKKYSIYAFTTLGGSYIVRDIFLDGNTFSDSHSVDKKPLVGELEVGVGVRYGVYLLSYTQVFRTREYDTQEFSPRFGSISLSSWF